MTKQVIDIGTVVQNGRDGDNARTSFIKVNANFTELYDKDSAVDSELATKATKVELSSGLNTKVDKVAGKGLSTNDYTTVEKTKLAGIAAGAQVNSVTSVAGRTGAVVLTKADVGLSNADNTSDANKPVSSATQTALNLKASSTDPRLSDSREWVAETVGQVEAEAGTATTRRAWTALRVRQAVAAWWAGVSTAFGRSLIAANDATAARTSLGLGAGNSPTFTALTLSGGHLTFPATQVPSADANTLDDYEEGTWTPVLTFVAPGDLSVAYSAQEGTYTKIGRTVFLGIRVISSTFTHTNASGLLQITGVPFSPSQAAFGALSWAGFSKAGYTQALFTQTPGSILGIRMSGNDLSTSLVSAADTASGTQINAVGNIFYDV